MFIDDPFLTSNAGTRLLVQVLTRWAELSSKTSPKRFPSHPKATPVALEDRMKTYNYLQLDLYIYIYIDVPILTSSVGTRLRVQVLTGWAKLSPEKHSKVTARANKKNTPRGCNKPMKTCNCLQQSLFIYTPFLTSNAGTRLWVHVLIGGTKLPPKNFPR